MNRNSEPFSFINDQGIALIQVLLLSSIISILAIRFTETAQDQISMAESFENRVRVQLKAQSVVNEIIFLLLSDSFTLRSSDRISVIDAFIDEEPFKFHGESISWGAGVTLQTQDLNGLLPQLFPKNELWRRVLLRRGLTEAEVARYIGVWSDMQDADNLSWSEGEFEPTALPNGGSYMNGFAQNEIVMRWVFEDKPQLLSFLLPLSNVNAFYETNLLNSPDALLSALFDSPTASSIMDIRSRGRLAESELRSLLPEDIDMNKLQFGNSGRLRIHVEVKSGDITWKEKRTIRLMASSDPPYQVWLNN